MTLYRHLTGGAKSVTAQEATAVMAVGQNRLGYIERERQSYGQTCEAEEVEMLAVA